MNQNAFQPAVWMMPNQSVYLPKWACVACDQFTSQPEYWREAEQYVGDAPSALKLILPECDLANAAQRVPMIHQQMAAYLNDGTLLPSEKPCYILVERSTGTGERVGLVGVIDLEAYQYQRGSKSLVRATEGTIVERIPPRLAVRRGAALELSHVLLLIDDPAQTVIEPIYDRRDEMELIYDFPLMMNGGHIRGYAVTDEGSIAQISAALSQLANMQGDDPLLFAVGDGNHSLATAKAYWEEIKQGLSQDQIASHPARYAMVELENIYDDALVFEPIHRVVYGYDGDAMMDDLFAYMTARNIAHAPEGDFVGDGGDVTCVFEGKQAQMSFDDPSQSLVVGTLQVYLDDFLKRHPECSVDYVHGEAAVRELCQGEGTVGFLLPALDKMSLFPAVKRDGALPRKTFSMGHAHEKRYYIEARKIK